MKNIKSYLSVVVLVPALGLVGCGGGSSSDGGSGSGKRTVGVIDSVSGTNVTVSGNSFDAAGASVTGDDAGQVSELDPGMVVTVYSDDDMDADEIDYDAEVEGMVSANNVVGTDGTLIVMGQTVTVSADTRFVSKIEGIDTMEAIPLDAVVEVSGFSDGAGGITATYVKLEDDEADEDDEMEVEGIVSNLDTTMMTFDINGFGIKYDENTEGVEYLVDGANVEVEIYMNADGMLIAEEIELEHDDMDGDEGDEIEIEGVVTSDGVVGGMFDVNGETVMLGDNVSYEYGTEMDIVNGAMIEVEGVMNESGMLIVHEVEFEHGMDDDSDDDMTTPDPMV